MEDAMGIDAQLLDSSSRIFDVYIPAIHGENPQRALGRLLQEIVADSGDISLLVGLVVFQLISRHTQLRHESFHLYLKMRSRQPSAHCEILRLRD
jgi:hypothetical protein